MLYRQHYSDSQPLSSRRPGLVRIQSNFAKTRVGYPLEHCTGRSHGLKRYAIMIYSND